MKNIKHIHKIVLWFGMLIVFVAVVYGIWDLFFTETTAVQAPTQEVLPKSEDVQELATTTVTINRTELTVEIADTHVLRTKGLAGKTNLSDEYGMLFVFDREQAHVFWMKGMEVPIDILWIKDGYIKGSHVIVQPEPGVEDSHLRQYPSPGAVDFVLEVRAGLMKQNNWRVGDAVDIQSF